MRYLTLLILLSFCVFPPAARAEVEAEGAWSPPTYGTPVVTYTTELSVDGSEWAFSGTTTDTTISFTFLENVSYRLRVAGIDADGHQGPFSVPSDPFMYGAPGEPQFGGVSGCALRVRSE